MTRTRLGRSGTTYFRWLMILLATTGALEAARRGGAWLHGRPVASASVPPPDGAGGERVVCLGHVDLRHGVAPLWPSVAGRVTSVPAVENATVTAGTVLLCLDDTLARARLQEAEADLRASGDQLAQARTLVGQHALKIAQQTAAVEAVGWRLEAARKILKRKRDLVRAGHANADEADAAEATVHEAEAAARAEDSKLKELQLVDPNLALSRAQAEVDARQARLAQARKAVDECCVRAPEDGTVLRVQARAGMLLSPQHPQPPLLFCPHDSRVVRAEVEQEFAGLVAVGQEAVIRDALSDQTTWRGRVINISDWYSHRRSIIQEPFQFNDVRTLECLVALDPDQPPLRIGQRVQVTLTATGRPTSLDRHLPR